MNGKYPWLYIDYRKNVWKFYVDNMNLYYKIMYIEGSWTKGKVIDKNVTEFSLVIDNNEIIHLVYGNKSGELKYCTIKNNKWVGKTLYKIENSLYDIENIKLDIIEANMNIFFTLKSNDGSDHGILMHCIWSGSKVNTIKISDIILESSLKEYFIVKEKENGELYLFYLCDEGDEISLNYTIYEKNKWRSSKRLYGIQGEDIFFDIEIYKDNIHILNKFKENNIYYLDHITMSNTGNLKYYNIYNSSKNIIDPIILTKDNNIYTSWIENNELYYSLFLDNNWDDKLKFNRGNSQLIERYNLYIKNNELDVIDKEKVYLSKDIEIYNPKEFFIVKKDKLEYRKENIDSIQMEINKLRDENSNLKNKIIELSELIKKDKKTLKNYEQQLLKALEQKRKAEENCNMFLKLQKKIQKENEEINKELVKYKKKESKDYLENNDEITLLKNNIKKLEDENSLIKNEINSMKLENKKID